MFNLDQYVSMFNLYLVQLREILKKKTIFFGNFSPKGGGGGLPKSQNFCKLAKYFVECQIHSEVLKHVLQRGGGGDI